jgi:hypothetical protein
MHIMIHTFVRAATWGLSHESAVVCGQPLPPVLSYPSLHYCLAQCQAFLSPVAASDWPIDSGSNSLL